MIAAVLFFILMSSNVSIAQQVDLSAVDAFFEVCSTLKDGKEISEKQWDQFEHSNAYRRFAESENPFLIHTIKNSIRMVFSKGYEARRDSILDISAEEMMEDKHLLIKKLILVNYVDAGKHFDTLQHFRDKYDFDALIEKAKHKLSSFLGNPPDSVSLVKPVYFLFVSADGQAREDALYIDFNFFFKKSEKQRTEFLAHEFFHLYREKFENHDFNYKSDLNHCIDMIQNEGIADQIDKSEGYKKYFSEAGESFEMIETWLRLYDQAPLDLERFQNVVLQYATEEITEDEMVDEMLGIVRFNGHPIGYFMANHIIGAGFKTEMLETFYNPYAFFKLYNKAAEQQNLFKLSNKFMEYLDKMTDDYYQ